MTNRYFEGKEVSLEQILDRREQRVLLQKKIIGETNAAVIYFTLNIAGNIKSFPMARLSFEEGCSRIDAFFKANHSSVIKQGKQFFLEGFEAFWAIDVNPLFLKQQMIALEEQDALSRFFDIDVLRKDGVKVSRTEIGKPERKCFLCSEPAAICVRSKKHQIDEISNYMQKTMCDYFARKWADDVASFAVKSLMYELAVSPKPGLVDRFDSGAHDDMDYFTFLDSIGCLYPYFRSCAITGQNSCDKKDSNIAEELRVFGIQAEFAMFRATNGINTYKGAIFSMGIMCAAAGRLLAEHIVFNENILFENYAKIASIYLEDFANGKKETAGEQVYSEYGIAGVRGEAAAGLPSVREYGLPVLSDCLDDKRMNYNDAGILTLLNLVRNTVDTTLVKRCGLEGLEAVRRDVAQVTEKYKAEKKPITILTAELNKKWSEKGISPGGCADLLALCFFVHFFRTGYKYDSLW